jgi:hypothetical protein
MENKTSKYFKYALGEIVLVVIGILIALQINNWNEERKDQIRERATLNKFLQDLESDSIFYQTNLKTIQVIDKLHKDLYLLGFKNKNGIRLVKPAYIRRTSMYYPIAKENDPNITNKINDNEVREDIQAYFREMKEVFQAKNEFGNVVFEIRALLRKLRTHHVNAWFESSMYLEKEGKLNDELITSSDLITLSKNEDFQQLLLESSLKLNEMRQSLELHIQNNSKLITKIKSYIKVND